MTVADVVDVREVRRWCSKENEFGGVSVWTYGCVELGKYVLLYLERLAGLAKIRCGVPEPSQISRLFHLLKYS